MAASRYMQKLYIDTFKEGLEFWTHEDGEPVAYVALATSEGIDQIKTHCLEHDIDFVPTRLVRKYAYREWVDKEEWGCRAKIWSTGELETPFPVWEYSYN